MYLIFSTYIASLFFFMILSAWLAFKYVRSQPNKIEKNGTGAIEAAVFGLLGLLVAFNFAGAYSRYETRRQIIVNEANAISTAFLRLDLLEPKVRSLVQQKFFEYLDLRISFFPKLINSNEVIKNLNETEELQQSIWHLVIDNTRDENLHTTRMLLLPTLNEMFDIVTTRTIAVQTHTSTWIFFLFFCIIIICSILSGMSMARSGQFYWSYMILFAAVTTITVYVILDLEYPRWGLIRLDFAQQALVNLKKSMVGYTHPST